MCSTIMSLLAPDSGPLTHGLPVQSDDAAAKQPANKAVKTSMLDEEIRARILAAKQRARTAQSSRSRAGQKVFRPQGWLRPSYKNKPLNLERRGYEVCRRDVIPVEDTAIQDCRYLRIYKMRRTIGMGLEEMLHDGHTNMERRLRDRDEQARREREWTPAARAFETEVEEQDSELDELEKLDDIGDHEGMGDANSLLDTAY